jgi:hypothetical protein
MPPPIVPASGSASLGTVTRLTEKVAPRATPIPGNPPTPSQAAPAPSRPEKVESVAPVQTAEPRATPAAAAPAASVAAARARPAAKAPPPAPDGAPKFGEARPLADKANAVSSVKPPAKVDDPFADLDSLEAEMARLLGREKLN